MGRAALLIAILLAVPALPADPPDPELKPEPVSPRLVRSLAHPVPNSPIWFLRYSADGRRLAVAGEYSGILQIWDPADGRELARVTPPPGEHGAPDYGALTADWKTALTVRNQKTARPEAVPPNQTLILFSSEVRAWDVATGKPRPLIKLAAGRGAQQVIASPDGTKLVTVEMQSFMQTELQQLPFAAVYRDLSKDGPPIELATGWGMPAFAPDGKSFVLATGIREVGQGRIRLFDALTGTETRLLGDEPKANIFFPSFSPDGQRVAAEVRNLEEKASVIKVWDRESGKKVAVLKPADPSILLYPGFSAGGRFVMAIAQRGNAYVWNVATGRRMVTHHFGDNGIPRTVAVRPDNHLAAAVGTPVGNLPVNVRDSDPAHYPQPHIILYDLTTGKPVETLVCPPGFPATAAFSPDGKTLAVGSSGAVHLFDVGDLLGRGR
ncbi:MAG TPA: hypothetical protein VH120_18245 [Gemmataceae bacterium]|nr:hypothetical protein [Gemmataceae bacterium]